MLTTLYRRLDVTEGEPVQYVAVYVTKWRPEWGEPGALFREVEDAELAAIPPVKALVEALHSISIMQTPDIMRDVAKQALAPFKEDE